MLLAVFPPTLSVVEKENFLPPVLTDGSDVLVLFAISGKLPAPASVAKDLI
jgi:hypothetical protein